MLAPSHYSTGNGQQCLWDSCGFTKHPSTCISYSFHTGWMVELSDSTEYYLVTWITLSKSHLQPIDSEFKFYARKVAFPLHNRAPPPPPPPPKQKFVIERTNIFIFRTYYHIYQPLLKCTASDMYLCGFHGYNWLFCLKPLSVHFSFFLIHLPGQYSLVSFRTFVRSFT